jgi:hypothetical protein
VFTPVSYPAGEFVEQLECWLRRVERQRNARCDQRETTALIALEYPYYFGDSLCAGVSGLLGSLFSAGLLLSPGLSS